MKKNNHMLPVTLLATIALLLSTVSSSKSLEEMRLFIISIESDAGAQLSASQVKASEGDAAGLPESQFNVSLQEEFRHDDIWFVSLRAPDIDALEAYLGTVGVQARSINESLFVNSPEHGGGPKAGATPRDGHKIYVIERDIPEVGFAPPEKLIEISQGSQSIIEGIGDGLEWDHSFMTAEGTYCVYRAGDPELIKQHAQMAGVPANPITPVEHIIRNFDFAS